MTCRQVSDPLTGELAGIEQHFVGRNCPGSFTVTRAVMGAVMAAVVRTAVVAAVMRAAVVRAVVSRTL